MGPRQPRPCRTPGPAVNLALARGRKGRSRCSRARDEVGGKKEDCRGGFVGSKELYLISSCLSPCGLTQASQAALSQAALGPALS